MKVVITYGTYDLLHFGHRALLERAKKLGDYLIVGVTSDSYDKERGKLNVQQSFLERVEAIKATGLADLVIAEEYEGQKIADIKKYGVDIFAIGSDWEGKFDYLKDYCEVVYLERTKGVSSTEIRAASNPIIKLGIKGMTRISERFCAECSFASGIEIQCVMPSGDPSRQSWVQGDLASLCHDSTDFYSQINAVAIFEPINQRFDSIMEALRNDCHVFCDAPLFMSEDQAKEAFALAKSKGLVLFDGVKTLFFPAFEHLLLLVASGVVGKVTSIDVSCSQVPEGFDPLKASWYEGAFYDWGGLALLPVIKLLGTDVKDVSFFSHKDNDVDLFTQGTLWFDDAIASIKVGIGVKTEGDMVITGTKGYVYVPAPWWLMDYFEIRYEDLRNTRREFYRYNGDGMRYEALEFARTINSRSTTHRLYSVNEVICEAKMLQAFKD